MDRRLFTKLCLGSAATLLLGQDEQKQQKKNIEVFLTVDDGWFYKKTILDIARAYKVPLNMFIIGEVIEKDPSIWANAIEEGHMLGCHTYHHHMLSKISETTMADDFSRYKRCVTNLLGQETYNGISFFRYPYGDTGNKRTKAPTKQMIADHGWKISWWNMDLSFASYSYGVRAYKNPNDQLAFFSKNLRSINIPLFHFKDPDVRGIEMVIKYGLENGFTFSRLDAKTSLV